MDSFEFNKIAGSVLATLLFVMGLGIFSDAIFSPGHMEKPGYALPAAEESHGAGAAVAATPSEPLPVLLAKADPKKGEGLVKACAACHSLDSSGAAKATGPSLYGVIDRAVGSTGFAYSDEIVMPALEDVARAARAIAVRGQSGAVQAWRQVSGSKFYYLKNEAALLELALINYTMQKVWGGG